MKVEVDPVFENLNYIEFELLLTPIVTDSRCIPTNASADLALLIVSASYKGILLLIGNTVRFFSVY